MTEVRETQTDRYQDSWRITIGNINSFPTEYNGNNKYKLDVFKELLVGNNSDIIMISEHNRNLQNMRKNETPQQMIKNWWPRTITRMSYLKLTSQAVFEPGGTMIITNSRSSSHTCQNGEYQYLLGRWNYILLRGKNGHYTTIISIYRPSKNQETYMRQTALTVER
jgi:hypothetical protein